MPPFYRARPANHLFQFSLRSRCTAMLAGLRTLTQSEHRPDFDLLRDDALGTNPASVREDGRPSSARCSLSRMPASTPRNGAPAQPFGRPKSLASLEHL